MDTDANSGSLLGSNFDVYKQGTGDTYKVLTGLEESRDASSHH